MVLHELNLAARYADRLVVMRQGAIVADGTPNDVMTPRMLADVFGIRARVIGDPETGAPVCLPYVRGG